MTLQADANGQIKGRFIIPSNIPSGTKSVNFNGSGGSSGQALYTGSGTVISRNLRRVITIMRGTDPLAQTFSLDSARQIAAVEVYFTVLGSKSVTLQIRQTQTGMPSQQVLAEATLSASQLSTTAATRFEFAPLHLEAATEYAIVILTDDAEHQLAVAELGQFDQQQGWVTAQPYQVGVLLSSSNAQTWTAHQNIDLTFNLLAAKYTSNSHQLALGQIDASNMTDLLMLAGVERHVADSDVQFCATTADGQQYQLQEDIPLNLATALTGPLNVSAELTGNEQFSPLLYPGIQLAKGQLNQTADYVTRAFNAGADSTLKVTFEAIVPGSAAISVLAEIDGVWQPLELQSATTVQSPWQELSYRLDNIQSASLRVKLILSGNAQNRPKVRQLRAITI